MVNIKATKGNDMHDQRSNCARCGQNPRAINYKKGERIYYRSICDACSVANIKRKRVDWIKKGYKKKMTCEACKFIPKHPDQLTVINHKENFKTVCLNCGCLSDIAFSTVTADF